MQTVENNYDIYNTKKDELIQLIKRANQAVEKLGIPSLANNLNKTSEKLSNSTFKIMVVGDFNSGKSTFINGLLGDYVLPTDVLECTAVITEVKYSKEKYAILHFKNPVPEHTNYDYVTPKAKAHIDKYQGKNIPELKLAIEEIDEFLVIQRDQETMEAKDAVNESPFERMELFWPCDLCEKNVEIIDSPGLNATEAKEKITIDYLNKIDSLVFVLSALKLCADNEIRFINEKLLVRGFEHTFFLVNRLNQINGNRNESAEDGRKKVLLDAKNRLRNKTKFGDAGIVGVNAYHAEQGRVNHDQFLVDDSQIAQFEQQLSEFLTKDKGKVKLSQPTKELKNMIMNVLVNLIPSQYKLNEDSLEEVAQKFNVVKPKLGSLEIRRKQISVKMKNTISDKEVALKRLLEKRYDQILSNLEHWIEGIDIERKFNLFKPNESAKAMIAELVEKLQEKISREQHKWATNVLSPYVENLTIEINDEYETDMKAICAEIDEIKVNSLSESKTGPKTWERVALIAGGILIHDYGVAVTGGIAGWKAAAINIGIQAGVLSGMLMLGITNPITIIPVLIGTGILALIIRSSGFGKKVINDAKPKIVEQFRKMVPEAVDSTTERIADSFNNQIDALATAVDEEIKLINEQFNVVIQEKQCAEHSAAERKTVIAGCETDLKNIMKGVDDINDYLLSL